MDPATASVDLGQIGVCELLDADSRPTFIVDLDPDADSSELSTALKPVFCNSALHLHQQLHDVITDSDISKETSSSARATAYLEFRRWVNSVTKHDDSKDIFPLFYEYVGMLWTGSTVRQRWRIISGNMLWKAPTQDLTSSGPLEAATGTVTSRPKLGRMQSYEPSARPSLARSEGTSASNTGGTLASSKQAERLDFSMDFSRTSNASLEGSSGRSPEPRQAFALSVPEIACPDWTAAEPKGVLTEHMRFARSINWTATPLGPPSTWSREFRQIANLCMGSPFPVAVLWGNELTTIFNDAYRAEVLGNNKHPALMGRGFAGEFSELWDGVIPFIQEMARTGFSIRRENDYLPIERFGFLEETFFSWSMTPLYGGTNQILGLWNAPFETTQTERHKRMLQTINRLGGFTSRAQSVKQYWKRLLEGLDDNLWDVPFALLYSVGASEDHDNASVSSGSTLSMKSCYLEGTIAVPVGHPAAPHQLDLKRGSDGFIPSFREAMRIRGPTLLYSRDGTFPTTLLEGITCRGFGEPCSEAVIFPLRPTNGDQVLAFLLIGLNPRRPYDDSYKSFIQLLNRALTTSLASILLFEDEMRRSRDAAEAAIIEQEKLSQALALQTDRLSRMTELSPLGMFLVTPEGIMREANDRFYEMTGLQKDDIEPMTWMEFLDESSRSVMEHGWAQLVEERVPWSGEIQLSSKAPHAFGSEEHIDKWVLFSAAPEFAMNSSLRSIMGSITDITNLKWAEGLQERRLAESIEEKRQQNDFIDITSHEMRNPLSAILQCADDISSALDEQATLGSLPSRSTIDNCIDAAKTISLCAQHQKNIVDDILTISKLDSNLLLITPTVARPVEVLHRSVKMIDSELQAKDIRLVFQVDKTYEELEIDWIAMDPNRVRQVLINLLTNAIKFTAESDHRVITVAVGASTQTSVPPIVPGFQLVPASQRRNDNITDTQDWCTGENLFLHFRVQDTGVGLTRDEKQTLFARFKQAKPRTHAQYGGSGLGLFICKNLCELHGGSIGVASEAGVGSTFGFYVKARRSHGSSEPAMLNRLGSDHSTSLTSPVRPARQEIAGPGPAAALTTRKATTSSFDPENMHILVVEDNLINQKVLVKQLKKHGCSVGVANDGIEALEFLAQTKYINPQGGRDLSIILMDLEMPRMGGLECVRKIRDMEREGEIHGHIPVLAITANVREEQIREARESGMDDVIPKPFTIRVLFERVETLLHQEQR